MKTMLTAFALATSCLLVSPALASKCAAVEPDRVAAEASAIFIGRVVALSPSAYSPGNACVKADAARPQCGGKVGNFKVLRNLKGSTPAQVSVLAMDGCYCLGGYFAEGQDYLIVAIPNPTAYPAALLAKDVCWGTGPAAAERQQTIIKRLARAP